MSNIVDFRITLTLLSARLGNSTYRISCPTNFMRINKLIR